MKRPSKWTALWILWLVSFGLIEFFAARSHGHRPRTLSEHLWRWFPKRWRRVLLVGLMTLLTWHFMTGPDVRPIEVTW